MAGKKNLMPTYDNVYPEIRKYDKDTIVMYEPVTWGIMSNKQLLGTGFDHPPGNDAQRTALSWHYYCWIIQINNDPLKNGTYPVFDKVFCDDWQLNDYFRSVEIEVATNLGNSPSFLTEFGTCSIKVNGSDPHKFNIDECKVILKAADNHMQSWTYWDSEFYYYDTWQVRDDLVNIFSRVYPMATNGIPVSIDYDVDKKKFQYVYNINARTLKQANLRTEIFVPKHAYPNGFVVFAPAFLTWNYDSNANRVYFQLTGDIVRHFETNRLFVFEQQAKIAILPK